MARGSLSVWPGTFDNLPGVSGKLDLNGSPRTWQRCAGPRGPPLSNTWHGGTLGGQAAQASSTWAVAPPRQRAKGVPAGTPGGTAPPAGLSEQVVQMRPRTAVVTQNRQPTLADGLAIGHTSTGFGDADSSAWVIREPRPAGRSTYQCPVSGSSAPRRAKLFFGAASGWARRCVRRLGGLGPGCRDVGPEGLPEG